MTTITAEIHEGYAVDLSSTDGHTWRADDCRECEDEQRGYIDRIESHITIAGAFDDDQQRRLREAAERCPVRKTLQKGMVVADDFAFES